ncbi:hypothetical protein BKA82DRAFT_90779, partial [Pisolithus tinctorius]
NSPIADEWDIISLQEPPINQIGNTHANTHWRVAYLMTKATLNSKPRAVTLVNSQISTNVWEQVPFPSLDIVVICMRTTRGTYCYRNTYALFNIYNDCKHNCTVDTL